MNKIFDREPALIVASIMAIGQGLGMLYTGDAAFTTPDLSWAIPVLTLLGGWLTKRKVFSPATVAKLTSGKK